MLVTTRPGLNLLAARLVRPSVVRVGQEHMNLASHSPSLRRAIEASYGRLDAVVTLTERDADYRQALAGSSTRVARVPNGVSAPTRPPAALKAPVLVAAGRLSDQKGFDLLLDAFALVAPVRPDWELRIFGSGHLRDDLEARIEGLGLSGRAHLAGLVRHMDRRLAGGSAYVLSSRYEAFRWCSWRQ